MTRCAFCMNAIPGELIDELTTAVAFYDAYPSTPGHILIVPRRHVGRLADLLSSERSDMFALLESLLLAPDADGYTIGINDGAAAGQTVDHVHLHIIPRRVGDTADPRGGVRWAVPETAAYWA